MFVKRLNEIEARKLEIRNLLNDGSQTPDFDKLGSELENLESEKKSLEIRTRIIAGITAGTTPTNVIPFADGAKPRFENRHAVLASKEYRNIFLKVMQHRGTPLNADEQAVWNAVHMEERFITGTSQGVIPTITLDLVKQKLIIFSAVYPFVDKFAVQGNLKIPKEDTTADAAWHVETAPINPAADSVDFVQLGGFELVKLVSISRAMETMSIEAFESYLVDKLAKKIMQAIEYSIINGVGTTEPLGIDISITWNAGNQITYASLDKMKYKDFTAMKALLKAPYHANARFVMNNITLWSGVANVLDALGRPIFVINPTLNLNGAAGNQDYLANVEVGRLLGTPVIMTPYMTDGDIYLGDLSYYAFNMAQDILIEKSYESSFKTHMVDFKAHLLGDGNVVLAEAFVKGKIL